MLTETSWPQAGGASDLMVRASLVKSDFLMRSLGRPNRDQIVSVRPSELTTLEAIDLSNGQMLADTLQRGSQKLLGRKLGFARRVCPAGSISLPSAASRRLTKQAALSEALGEQLTEQGIQDALWTVIMLPEFQLVR